MEKTAQKTPQKMVVGWFTFTCSEDSTILFTELLNDYYDIWKNLVEFRHVKSLRSKNALKDLDVAFVEGAISSPTQEAEVKQIRENSKYVVAIGQCACTGMPSASRNAFGDSDIDSRIKWFMTHFNYSKNVKKLEDVVKVDDKVEGCPMNAKKFLEILDKYLTIFNKK